MFFLQQHKHKEIQLIKLQGHVRLTLITWISGHKVRVTLSHIANQSRQSENLPQQQVSNIKCTPHMWQTKIHLDKDASTLANLRHVVWKQTQWVPDLRVNNRATTAWWQMLVSKLAVALTGNVVSNNHAKYIEDQHYDKEDHIHARKISGIERFLKTFNSSSSCNVIWDTPRKISGIGARVVYMAVSTTEVNDYGRVNRKIVENF